MFVTNGISEILCTGEALYLKRHMEHTECDNFFEIT